ncbi:MAG: DUF1573 domain-containing protein [Candidatus Beckwithbacteria bacterium]|nr:DUF1573 domain-containing protein [Candidatus Beckwithbacteria bacterium]
MGRKLVLAAVVVAAAIFVLLPKQPLAYKDLSVAEFDKALKADPFVVDVHTPEQTHLEGTDAFIPYDQIDSHLNDLPADKNAEIILYCRSGSMSSQAAQVLIDQGYTNVKHLAGGIQAWREQHQGIKLTPVTQDLGTVIYGDMAKTEFTLANNTNQIINLTRVSTSCSCTQAQAETLTLEPYASTNIVVSFDPAVHKDDTDLGDITRTIFVDTDHQNFPQVEAQITAQVVKP